MRASQLVLQDVQLLGPQSPSSAHNKLASSRPQAQQLLETQAQAHMQPLALSQALLQP